MCLCIYIYICLGIELPKRLAKNVVASEVKRHSAPGQGRCRLSTQQTRDLKASDHRMVQLFELSGTPSLGFLVI